MTEGDLDANCSAQFLIELILVNVAEVCDYQQDYRGPCRH